MQPGQKNIVVPKALRESFDAGWKNCRVIFISAPCGFGKTAAAHVLLKHCRIQAYSAAVPGSLSKPLRSGADVILIDDFQAVRDTDEREKICGWINGNPKMHFVFLSRGALPGWLMPYQFTGMLTLIESAQLVLDRGSAAELFTGYRISLSAEELTAVLKDSAGYPLALSILCRKLSGGIPYSERIADEARREMFFHFEEAVYRRFEQPMRKLLVSLSPFDTFDAELAKMISGDSHVNDLLAQLLHETNMLLYDNVETYHFWRAFRLFLSWELKQDCTTEEQNDIYRRAGLYHELHDNYAQALDCYTKSGDHRKISELLIKNAELHPGVAHYYDMEQYYYALPREDVLRSPALMCGMSMLTAVCLDYEASEQWYAELQNYASRLKKTDAEYAGVKSRLIYLDIALPQRGSRGLIELIGTVFRAIMNRQLKLNAFSVTSCLPSIMNGGKDFCEWSRSDDLLYRTMRLPVETVLGRDGVGLADCAICESKFEKGEDISERILALMSRMSEIERKGTPDIVFAALGLLVRTQVMQGKAKAALDALEGLETDFTDTGQTRFLPNLRAMRCRILLRLGRQEEADWWLRDNAPSSTPHFRALWRYQYMTKAMVQIADGDPDEALLSIAPLLPYCEKCGRTMDGLYLRLLIAVCHYRKKDSAWEDEISEALDIARSYRFIMPAAQFGAAVLPLLTGIHWDRDPAFFKKLLAETRTQTVHYPDFLRPSVTLANALSPAETQVLRLLCSNRSNQEIADILGVKLPTVKTQVRSIMQKLNVKRRSEAKDAAQRLHLI